MKKTNTILGLIPARGGSKGVPRKNARSLAGRPLVEYTIEAAQESQELTRTILSTDDQEIADLAAQHGVEVPFLRPAELARDDSATVSVVAHLLDWLERQGRSPDIVVLLQPTSPLRRGVHIDQAIELLRNGSCDSVVSITRVPAHFHPRWQFTSSGGKLETFTGEPLAQLIKRRQDLELTYTRNGAIYAFHRATLERTGTLYGDRCLGYEMPPELSINIDTLEDWARAEAALARSDEARR